MLVSLDLIKDVYSGQANNLAGIFTSDYCVWSEGIVANRADLIKRTGLNSNSSNLDIIAALYKRYGVDTPKEIEGTASFILWDIKQKQLLAVRDRVGLTKLFYRFDNSIIKLSDHANNLLAKEEITYQNLDPISVIAFLNNEPPLNGASYFKQIKAVKPGTTLLVRRDGVRTLSYWQMMPQKTLKIKIRRRICQRITRSFFNVIPQYAQEDKIGVTLSGGLDSTTVAASIHSVLPDKLMTSVSWVSPELPEADESQKISEVSRFLHLQLIPIRADLLWPLSKGDHVPFFDSPYIPYYRELWEEAFRVVKENNIKILLSGAFGDDLFGGNVYAYSDLLLTGKWTQLVHQVLEHQVHTRLKLKSFIRMFVLKPIFKTYFQTLFKRPSSSEYPDWINPKYKSIFEYYKRQSTSELNKIMLPGRQQRFEFINLPMFSHVMGWFQEAAQAYQIQLLHPLADRRIIEFALSLPTDQSIKGGVRKIIIRNAMKSYLPESIIRTLLGENVSIKNF